MFSGVQLKSFLLLWVSIWFCEFHTVKTFKTVYTIFVIPFLFLPIGNHIKVCSWLIWSGNLSYRIYAIHIIYLLMINWKKIHIDTVLIKHWWCGQNTNWSAGKQQPSLSRVCFSYLCHRVHIQSYSTRQPHSLPLTLQDHHNGSRNLPSIFWKSQIEIMYVWSHWLINKDILLHKQRESLPEELYIPLPSRYISRYWVEIKCEYLCCYSGLWWCEVMAVDQENTGMEDTGDDDTVSVEGLRRLYKTAVHRTGMASHKRPVTEIDDTHHLSCKTVTSQVRYVWLEKEFF